jgi:hypothetical protein
MSWSLGTLGVALQPHVKRGIHQENDVEEGSHC